MHNWLNLFAKGDFDHHDRGGHSHPVLTRVVTLSTGVKGGHEDHCGGGHGHPVPVAGQRRH